MQQRYYDPVAGRFLSVDPVTTDADTGHAFNRYEYANSNPYRYTDPDGRDAWYKEAPPPPPPPPPTQLPPVTVVGKREAPTTSSVAPALPIQQLPGVVVTAPRLAPLIRLGSWMLLATPTTLGDGTCSRPGNPCGMESRPKNPPDVGPPNGWIQGPRRGRQYGPDGKPVLDIDQPHQGNEEPHAHEWPGGQREEPGRPVSPWPPKP